MNSSSSGISQATCQRLAKATQEITMYRRQPRADHKRPGHTPAADKAAMASPAAASAGIVPG